ncbi:hypothetical protein [Solirubrobacter soli]|uniref:hypothetical protein n=1 Tax=Solirubrobacter soli TaxID=363832 RepID=UPI00040B87B6|nr:hypothetical protein [Solirubrobacter soli]
MYKTIAGLAAAAAVFVAFHNARAVEDPPQAHLQLIEVEQQTPYLESFAGVTAGTATVSIIRRVSQAGTSSQSYAQFDNHNGDGSRASFPLDVEDGDTYGVSASLVKGPNFGIVQLFVDGRQIGGTYDLYAPAITVAQPMLLGPLALSEGKHVLTMKVVGKNEASTDFLGGIDLLVLDSAAAPQPTPTAVATAEVGAEVPATLALTLGTNPTFGAFVPGVAKEYTASATANVVSSAADAALTVSDPGKLANGTRTLRNPLQVAIAPNTWSDPVSNGKSTITFKQAIDADEPLRTGSYTKTLTFTLGTTNP